MVGCLDLNDQSVESAATVVARIKRALQYIPASQVILAPDCGTNEELLRDKDLMEICHGD